MSRFLYFWKLFKVRPDPHEDNEQNRAGNCRGNVGFTTRIGLDGAA